MEINTLSHSPTTHQQEHSHKSRASTELSESEKSALRGELADTPTKSTPPTSQTSSGAGDLSGVYLGILNLYVTLPQFIGTFISWAVFSILEPGKSPELAKEAHPTEHHSTEGPNAIAVCLFIGAVCAVRAAQLCARLK
jgi:solute carrier family 45, member 1/2/4